VANLSDDRLPWPQFASELIGTGLLVGIGLSLVIVMFGAGSPMAVLLPDETVRRTITGFLFGSVGGLLAVSPVGRVSGAHINPVVTLGFWMFGKLDPRTAAGYVVAQLTGAVAGAVPLLLWGQMGRSIAYGATIPGPGYRLTTVLLGEAVTTFALVGGLCLFLAIRELRPFTPAMIPFLYAVMVPLEAAISGTSTNPARSLGPAVIAGAWQGWWIYWVGPVVGTAAAVFACSFLATRIEVAKLYYFDQDRGGVFHRMSQAVAQPSTPDGVPRG
jgi:aquaporin Z